MQEMKPHFYLICTTRECAVHLDRVMDIVRKIGYLRLGSKEPIAPGHITVVERTPVDAELAIRLEDFLRIGYSTPLYLHERATMARHSTKLLLERLTCKK